MRKDHKRALAILLNKKVNITSSDLDGIFITRQAQKNALQFFHRKKYLILEKEGFLIINKDMIPEIVEELSR